VELNVAAWLVCLMVSLPLIFAPFRALVGFRSDVYQSALGWKRVPYIWIGTMLQFGGLAIMPFALIVLSGDTHGPAWIGHAGAALAFFLVGAGLQTTQTTGLALATDLAPDRTRPRVVALMYVSLLIGMLSSGLVFGLLLHSFSELRLIQVVQGAALLTMVLNLVALWKQEPRNPNRAATRVARPGFAQTWRSFARQSQAPRFLTLVALGTAGFNMQDVILEPYGGQILHLGVAATTLLTALLAGGALCAFGIAAKLLQRGIDPYRLAAFGMLLGIAALSAIIFSGALQAPLLFRVGTFAVGCGGGLFSVGTLIAAMALETRDRTGLALGAWGAAQALSAGLAIAFGGALRDVVSGIAEAGHLGVALANTSTGYCTVYHIEIALLFAALVALGPLVRSAHLADPPTHYADSRVGP
ncbi:MAG: MFS transporter, partial [Burkholderiaceae bacterium]